MQDKFLQVTDHIQLRWPHIDLAAPLLRIIEHQRPYLIDWMPWIEQTEGIKDVKKQLWEWQTFTSGGQQLITFIFYDELLVGSIGFIVLDSPNRKAELGYWVREEMQGKGIITRSCSKLIDYGFRQLALNKVSVKVPSNNSKSAAIPERLGFQKEGVLRQELFIGGRFHDVHLFSLLKKEWQKKSKSFV